MKSYWDHEESERAKLTEQEVTDLLDFELMAKGVLKVKPLVLQEEQPVEMRTRRVFSLYEEHEYGGCAPDALGFACDTVEEAEACRDIIRHKIITPYREPTRLRPTRRIVVIAEELPEEATVAAKKEALEKKAAAEQANKEAMKAHAEAMKKVHEATSGVWEDWYRCQRQEARHQKVRDTLAEYLKLTGGNEPMALAFLAKAFPAEEIGEATGVAVAQPVTTPAPAPSVDEIAF